MVRIPDYPNVRVLADNQPAGRTDASGSALIPRLRAYDKNVISIDQRDLPLDAEISTLKLDAIPYFRSGVEIKFPIRHSRGATLTIHFQDGKPLPVGASVQEIGKDAIFTVGYNGEVYVVGLDSITRLRATWGDQSCEFDVAFIASADPLPDLGTFICQGISPTWAGITVFLRCIEVDNFRVFAPGRTLLDCRDSVVYPAANIVCCDFLHFHFGYFCNIRRLRCFFRISQQQWYR